MEKVFFNEENRTSIEGKDEETEEQAEEDYSASVSAILLRRASSKQQHSKRRRASSTFSPESVEIFNRRRSSNVTTTSVETAITIEEGLTEEHIFQNIKLHKEVLSNVKQQPWPMRRKVKLVKQAKNYVKKHEGELQERLAQSKTTKDMLACCDIIFVKEWQFVKRELANLMNVIVPWELRIKEIESHFGSVVASYFTFLRWLFWVNLVIATILVIFVAIPEVLTADRVKAGERKEVLEDEKASATYFMTLWDFEGALKYSPMFYGYYSSQESSSQGRSFGYKGPLAYFVTGLAVYIYSFVATLRRMAENSRQSKLSEKDDECVFTWKLFTGWDYMIGNSETAHNRTASIILGFKEALLEEAEKKRDERSWKMLALRIFTNLNVLWLFASSVYAVVFVVERSSKQRRTGGWWEQNEVTIVVSLITNVFPFIFEMLGSLEQYHPRKRLRMQLARIMVLNMLNLYTFILASFSKISDMSIQLQDIKRNLTNVSMQPDLILGRPELLTPSLTTVGNNDPSNLFSPTYSPSTLNQCYVEKVNCSTRSTQMNDTPTMSTSTPPTAWTQSTQLPSTISTLTTLLLLSTTISNNSLLFDNVQSNVTRHTNENDNDNYNQDSVMAGNSAEGYYGYDYESFSEYNSSANIVRRDVNASGATNYIVPLSVELFNFNKNANGSLEGEDENFLTPEDYPDYNDTDVNSSGVNMSTTTDASTTTDDGCTYITICPDSSTTTMSPPIYTYTASTQQMASISVTRGMLPETPEAWPQKPLPTTVANSEYQVPKDLSLHTKSLDIETRRKLRSLCWETMFGQELVKLTVMDLVLTILSTLMVDFIRAIFVRVMNNCWCWDLEKKFPQYGDFKIAENILHLVNNQGMVWMGMFFSPGLPLINLIKLVIMMYLRSWTVLTCNVPHEVVFRASRSNNFYLALLLTMLFLCVLPVSYAIVWVEPSWHCGPFSNYEKIYHLFTNSTKKALPSKTIHKALDYIASPGIVIPLFLLLVLIIYYLVSLTNALREANNDLKVQLRRERTEERRKVFQMVDRKHRGGTQDLIESTPFQKWQKTINVLPGSKSDQTSNNTREGGDSNNGHNKTDPKKLLYKLTKHTAQRHGQNEENVPIVDADGTDVEQAESLPDDNKKAVAHHHSHHHNKQQVHSKPHITSQYHHTQQKSPVTVGSTEFADVHAASQNKKQHHADDNVFHEKQIKTDKRDKKQSYLNTKHQSPNGKDTISKKMTKQVQERKESVESIRSENIPEIRISQSTDDESSTDGAKRDRPSKSSSADTIIEQTTVEKCTTHVDEDEAYKVESESVAVKEKQSRHHGTSHKQIEPSVATTKHRKSQEETNMPVVIKHGKVATYSEHKPKSEKGKVKDSTVLSSVEQRIHVSHKEMQRKNELDHGKVHKSSEKKSKHNLSHVHPDEASSTSSKERNKHTTGYKSEDSGDEKVGKIKKKPSDIEILDKSGVRKMTGQEVPEKEELSFKVKPRRKVQQGDDVTTKHHTTTNRRVSGQIKATAGKHDNSSSNTTDSMPPVAKAKESSTSTKRHEDRVDDVHDDNGKLKKKWKKKTKDLPEKAHADTTPDKTIQAASKENTEIKVMEEESSESDTSVKTEKQVKYSKSSRQPVETQVVSESEDSEEDGDILDQMIVSTTVDYDEPVVSVVSEESDFQNDDDYKSGSQSTSNSTISSKQSMESRSQSQSKEDD